MAYVPTLSPVIAIHLSSALAGLALGPVVLWARKGAIQRPRLHRAFGYAFVTAMVSAAISAMFIRDFRSPNIWGYTLIHLFVVVTAYSLFDSFYNLAKGNIAKHRKSMQGLYYGGCVTAGVVALLPGRFMVIHQAMGLAAGRDPAALAYLARTDRAHRGSWLDRVRREVLAALPAPGSANQARAAIRSRSSSPKIGGSSIR